MHDLALLLAGVAWDNELRGALTVVLGCTVLMGSVWLLLATNTGIRLGSLLALAGFFGWMFLMGLVWWIYGIGYVGSTPSWVFEEMATQNSIGADIAVDDVEQIVDPAVQPRAIDLIRESGDEALIAEFDTVDVEGITTRLTDANEALPANDPRKVTDATLDESIATAIDDAGRRNEQLTLTQLAAVAPQITDAAIESGQIDTGDWRLVDAGEAGEAQTAATAALLEEGTFTEASEFVFIDAYQQGGKPRRADNSIWNRFTNRIDRLLTITHPTNHIVVQVQQAIEKETPLGGTPAFAEADPAQPVLNVVLVRDIGDRRLPPAIVTIVSFLLFVATSLMLHLRDRNLAATEKAYAANGA